MMQEALDLAIRTAGGAAKVARAMGIKRQAVSQWSKCPPARVNKLSEMSGIPPHVLRPDIFKAPSQVEAA